MAAKKDTAPAPTATLPHRVLICSEEQFKVFTLPQLKPFCKFKLTAHEGSRTRKLDLAEFVSTADPSYSESCLAVATNQGAFSLFSLPDCRRQLYAPYIKKEDISGINSVVFTRRGEALYLSSASELERVSLSARHVTRPRGEVAEVGKVAPLAAPPKKEGQSQEGTSKKQGGEGGAGPAPPVPPPTTTTTTTSTPASTTTTTTTTTTAAPTTNTAAAAAEPADTTTVQLKTSEETRNGEKDKEKEKEKEEEAEGKTGGATGETATGGGGGGGGGEAGGRKAEDVKENGDNSVLSGDITIDSIRDHIVAIHTSS